MNHYPRHVGDITQATFGLSLTEFGAYDRLLDAYYANEAPLPLSAPERYRMAGAATKQDRAAVDYVLTKFFVEREDGWHQNRCDRELAAYRERSESARRSINARWSKRNTETDTNVLQANGERNTNQKPVTSNQEPVEARAEPPARKRAAQLSPDWSLPDDWKAWALQEKPGWGEADVLRVSLLFCDYWRSKGEARVDWLATWRLWVRRERTEVVSAKSARQKVNDAIWGVGNEHGINDITGESERVT